MEQVARELIKLKNLFNKNEGLFKQVQSGNVSGIIFTLLLPIIAQFLTLPILMAVSLYINFIGIKQFGFVRENSFSLDLILSTGSVILVYFLIVKFKEKRNISSMGFSIDKNTIFRYLRGFLMGILMMGIIALLIVITGSGEFVFNRNINLSFISSFILVIIAWIIQGASEEIMMRGHMLPTLGVKINPIVAIIISSSYFGILHLGNPGIAPLAIVNLILFGIFAAIYSIYEESLLGVCALHSAWNFAQGNIFGFLVSGMEAEGGIIISTRITQNNLINGGTFGPEGGIITTIVLAASIIILICLLMRKNKLKK